MASIPICVAGFMILIAVILFDRDNETTLCLVTNQNDPEWSTYVNWVLMGTMYAESHGITNLNPNDMPAVKLYGPDFVRMFRDLILLVGNYAQIYERNLEEMIPRSGLNMLVDDRHPGGQHYPLESLLAYNACWPKC